MERLNLNILLFYFLLMLRYFITQAEPLHPQRGKEVLFFVREQDLETGISRSHRVVKEVPHIFFTPRFSRRDLGQLDALFSQCQSDPLLSSLVFEKKEDGPYHFFLQARGSKEEGKLLPSPFLCNGPEQDPCGLNSPSHLLHWWYPAGMLIDSPEKIPLPSEIRSRKYVPLEALVRENYAGVDIELEHWEVGRDHIFMVMCVSPTQKVIFHDLPFPNKKQEGFRLVRYASQQELGRLLSELVFQEDPLWIYGHNVMNFDQLKLRDLTEAYYPAVDGHYPVTKSVQGLGRVITRGRFTIDSRLYSTNYRNVHADNKLETVTEGFEKTIDYAEQAYLVALARKGNEDAFRKLAQPAFKRLVHYGLEDILVTVGMCEGLKELVARKNHYFRASPDAVSSTSKLTLGEDYWQRRHFMVTGTYADSWRSHRKTGDNFSVDLYLKLKWPSEFHPGFFPKTHLVYLTPFLAAAALPSGTPRHPEQTLLEENDFIMLKRARASSTPLEKFDLYQTVNAKLSYLFGEIRYILERERKDFTSDPSTISERQDYFLSSLFRTRGLARCDPHKIVQNVGKALSLMYKALLGYKVINHGTYLTVLGGKVQADKLESSLYGCYLGEGPTLSLGENSFVINPWGAEAVEKFVYQGVGINRGWNKTNFEKRVLAEVVGRIFAGEGFKPIRKYLDGEIKTFVSGEGKVLDYLVEPKRRTYYKNLLVEVLENGGADPELVEEYKRWIKPNIGERFSAEMRKRLYTLLEKAPQINFIREIVDELEHPYPRKVKLVYAAGWPNLLLPESYGFTLNLDRYREKVKGTFECFYAVLKVR